MAQSSQENASKGKATDLDQSIQCVFEGDLQAITVETVIAYLKNLATSCRDGKNRDSADEIDRVIRAIRSGNDSSVIERYFNHKIEGGGRDRGVYEKMKELALAEAKRVNTLSPQERRLEAKQSFQDKILSYFFLR